MSFWSENIFTKAVVAEQQRAEAIQARKEAAAAKAAKAAKEAETVRVSSWSDNVFTRAVAEEQQKTLATLAKKAVAAVKAVVLNVHELIKKGFTGSYSGMKMGELRQRYNLIHQEATTRIARLEREGIATESQAYNKLMAQEKFDLRKKEGMLNAIKNELNFLESKTSTLAATRRQNEQFETVLGKVMDNAKMYVKAEQEATGFEWTLDSELKYWNTLEAVKQELKIGKKWDNFGEDLYEELKEAVSISYVKNNGSRDAVLAEFKNNKDDWYKKITGKASAVLAAQEATEAASEDVF